MSKPEMDCKPPKYDLPSADEDPRTKLRNNVIEALKAVPVYFTTAVNVEGIDVTDVFGVNQLLGSSIEVQTVAVLNRLREIWDPDNEYAVYEFRRFPQSFPDVRLVGLDSDADPIIGIELKGWYLLSKETKPSFRFKASAAAMTEYDLLVCYPWSLTNVISGKPVLHPPYIEQAKWVADMRTYYWQHREGSSETRIGIKHPKTHPYPEPRSKFTDVPEYDGGSNFGRVGRIHTMDSFLEKSLDILQAGIAARYWVGFFKLVKEASTHEDIERGLSRLENKISQSSAFAGRPDDVAAVMEHVSLIVEYTSR